MLIYAIYSINYVSIEKHFDLNDCMICYIIVYHATLYTLL